MPTTRTQPRLLITAGPTHEPIDEVRFLGNRSSGKLGVSLAEEAARRGMRVTLLLGPTALHPTDTPVETVRFRSASDLEALLREHLPHCDCLVMAAAIADYRPIAGTMPAAPGGKMRREKKNITLELKPTPDLLAGCAAMRTGSQLLVGFALEPREGLIAAARAKLERKNIDAIVANPLETMDAADIEATLVWRSGETDSTHGAIPKPAFARWLLDRLVPSIPSRV